MKKGFIYILSNKIFHNNLLKIGMTKSETIKRKSQLSSSTAIPEEFIIEGSFYFFDITNIEKEIHQELSSFRYKKNKEFFTCDLNTAKYVILKAQINDHKKFITSLAEINENLLNELNSTETITEKWKLFFSNLNWKFVENHYSLSLFNLELFTKEFDFIENGETAINNSKAYIKTTNAKEFHDVNNETIKLIEGLENKENRLFLFLNKPIIEWNQIYLGYEYKNHEWEKIRIINYDNKYGLFDENKTYFDFINGRFPERENLFFAEKEIMENWK